MKILVISGIGQLQTIITSQQKGIMEMEQL